MGPQRGSCTWLTLFLIGCFSHVCLAQCYLTYSPASIVGLPLRHEIKPIRTSFLMFPNMRGSRPISSIGQHSNPKCCSSWNVTGLLPSVLFQASLNYSWAESSRTTSLRGSHPVMSSRRSISSEPLTADLSGFVIISDILLVFHAGVWVQGTQPHGFI